MKYHYHPIALTDEEQKQFDAVKKSNPKLGYKKIFMAMINVLHGQLPREPIQETPNPQGAVPVLVPTETKTITTEEE